MVLFNASLFGTIFGLVSINLSIKSNFCFLNYNNKVDKIENSEHDCNIKCI